MTFSFRTKLAAWMFGFAAAVHPVLAAEPYPYSTDPAIKADQMAAYDVVHRYETLLNAGDTADILKLFAPDSVAEWNDKPTAATDAQRADIYNSLFEIAKFTTVFGYAGIITYGDTAVVRTFHHKSASVVENGKTVADLNREVFVLHRIDGQYRIILYIFNTNPVQGEG
jgi:ketosteroid isomerase-like protein